MMYNIKYESLEVVKMYQKVVSLLESRGVTIDDIVDVVIFLQEQYVEDIHSLDLRGIVNTVLKKREVQHAIITGIEIDKQVEQQSFGDSEISSIIFKDQGLYGIDEVLAYGICNLYGSIALTNFGYVDKIKPGIIGRLNDHNGPMCHTFLDDLVGAVAAAAAGKLAHSNHEEHKITNETI